MLSRARFVMGLAMVFAIATLVVMSGSQAQLPTGPESGGTTTGLITSVPRTMTYQGILNDSNGDPVRNTTLNVTFRIFDAYTGGNQLWTEVVQIETDQRANFTATLSDLNLPFDEDYYLELQIEGDPQPLEPRQKLHMVPYSARTDTSDYAFSSLSGGGWVDDGAVVRLETSTDNVGIGTTTPDEKLEVDGTIHSMSGGFKFPDNTVQITASSPLGTILDYGTSNNSGTVKQMSEIKICYGTAFIPPGNYTTITGLPFSSASSYTVIVSRQTQFYVSQAITTRILSGSAFEIHDFTYNSSANWIAFGY